MYYGVDRSGDKLSYINNRRINFQWWDDWLLKLIIFLLQFSTHLC